MTPTHEAALDSARDSLGVLKEILASLPDEAMSYVPVRRADSLTVLVAHALSATKFLYSCGSGQASSFLEYRSGERASSFEVKDGTVASLTAAINAGLADFARSSHSGRRRISRADYQLAKRRRRAHSLRRSLPCPRCGASARARRPCGTHAQPLAREGLLGSCPHRRSWHGPSKWRPRCAASPARTRTSVRPS